MSLYRETILQLALERGRANYPVEEDRQDARNVVSQDRQYRFEKKLPARVEEIPLHDYVYDIETYPNLFTFSIKRVFDCQRWFFEISDWVNQGQQLFQFLNMLRETNARMVGYNNISFDYPVIHLLVQYQGVISCNELYNKAQSIINGMNKGDRFSHIIWDRERHVEQIDLFKIHHFDNMAKSTSLKMLEFNMRSPDIQELPYSPLKKVTRNQAERLISYNDHDVDETEKFYFQTLPLIRFREKLTTEYGRNFINHNDTKIGKDYFIMELEKNGINTKGVQTVRDYIALGEVIFPYVQFEHPEFNRILNFFRNESIDANQIKGFFKDLSATINGFKFDFGAGGIHGSLHKTIVRESNTHKLIDIDVASYYPNLAIANRLFPEHLTDKFCDIYLALYNQRVEAKLEMETLDKNSARYKEFDGIQAMIKLALNGVYGSSNDQFSPFLDPKYTMSITINGQLLLCMLAEQLMKIPDLKMVQINTDGLTFLCPNEYVEHTENLKSWWENLTNLQLERADYSLMAIRDVNSYLAVTTDGKVKRIGAYAYETALENPATREIPWHKDHSALVIPKAAEAALLNGTPIREFILNHDDEFDFMLRTKVPRSSRLELRKRIMWGDTHLLDDNKVTQNITRYYVSDTGGKLVKVMPPTVSQIKHWNEGDHYQHKVNGDYKVMKKGKKPPSGMYELITSPEREAPEREIGIQVGYLVTDCSNMENYYDDKAAPINYEYYINEARKLVDELLINKE